MLNLQNNQDSVDIKAILGDAYRELEKGNAELALKKFDSVLKKEPRNLHALMGKAKSLYVLKRVETAKHYFYKASVLEPKFKPEIDDILSGKVLLTEKTEKKAVVAFQERWARIDGKSEDVNRNYPGVESDKYLGLSPSAVNELQDIDEKLKRYPNLPELWVIKGTLLAKNGMNEIALRCFDTALGYNQNYIVALNAKAELLTKLGKHAEATSVYYRIHVASKNARNIKKDDKNLDRLFENLIKDRVKDYKKILIKDPEKKLLKKTIDFEMEELDRELEEPKPVRPVKPEVVAPKIAAIKSISIEPEKIAIQKPATVPVTITTEEDFLSQELLMGTQPAKKPKVETLETRPSTQQQSKPPIRGPTPEVSQKNEVDLLTKELFEGVKPVKKPIEEAPSGPITTGPIPTDLSTKTDLDSLTKELFEGVKPIKKLQEEPSIAPSITKSTEPSKLQISDMPQITDVDLLTKELLVGTKPIKKSQEKIPVLGKENIVKEREHVSIESATIGQLVKELSGGIKTIKKGEKFSPKIGIGVPTKSETRRIISRLEKKLREPIVREEIPVELLGETAQPGSLSKTQTERIKAAKRGLEKSPILDVSTRKQRIFGQINGIGKVNGMVNGSGKINGLINGKRKFTGIINGRGRINGLVNGKKRLNGLINGMGRINGLVNGKRVRGTLSGFGYVSNLKEFSGMVNGAGRVNGLVNGRRFKGRLGRINGLINGQGRINGLINGAGRVNGLINGKRRLAAYVNGTGKINGRVNGKRVRGQINGLMVAKGKINGWINGGRINGLINGRGQVNGLINGMGYDISSRRTSHRRIMVRDFVVTFSIIGILGLGAILLYLPTEKGGGISIDGNFNDWKGVPLCSKSAHAIDPNIEISNYTVTYGNDKISFYLEVKGTMLGGEPGNQSQSRDSVDIFIDSDTNPSTGYMIDGIGADYMISIYGKGGVVEHSVMEYYPDNNGLDWNRWTSPRDVKTAVSGGKLETQVGKFDIGLSRDSKNVNILFHTMDWTGAEDFSEAIINPVHPSLYVYQQSHSIGDTILKPNDNGDTQLLDLTLKTYTKNVTVDKLVFNLNTGVSLGHLSQFTAYSDSGKKFVGTAVGNKINLDGLLPIPKGSSDNIRVYTNFLYLTSQDEGKIFGIRLESVDTTEHAVLTIQGTYTNIYKYISQAPTQISIDGAFGDWQNTKTAEVGNVNDSNVDITNYDTKVQGSDVMFYLRVDGTMMGGKAVPTNVVSIPYQPPTKPPVPDSDRDTMNDSVDPYPHDFNNDGINDSATWGVHNGIYGPDVDGDGITDYPYGPDMWLNTTIPSRYPFPKDYWNKTVNVYIGPVKNTTTPLPVVTGEDNAYAFINSDNNNNTGCTNSQESTNVYVDSIRQDSKGWSSTASSSSEQNRPKFTAPDGTDYLIHLSGKENILYSSKLYKWDSWNWSFVKNVSAAIDGEQMEFGTLASDLNINGNFSVSFETENWNKTNDNVNNIVLPYDHSGSAINTIYNEINQNEITPNSNNNVVPKNSLQIGNNQLIPNPITASAISSNQQSGTSQSYNFYEYTHETAPPLKKPPGIDDSNQINEYSPDSRIFSGIPANMLTLIKNPYSKGLTADYIYIIPDLWWINVKDNMMDSVGIQKDLVRVPTQSDIGQQPTFSKITSTSTTNTLNTHNNGKDSQNINENISNQNKLNNGGIETGSSTPSDVKDTNNSAVPNAINKPVIVDDTNKNNSGQINTNTNHTNTRSIEIDSVSTNPNNENGRSQVSDTTISSTNAQSVYAYSNESNNLKTYFPSDIATQSGIKVDTDGNSWSIWQPQEMVYDTGSGVYQKISNVNNVIGNVNNSTMTYYGTFLYTTDEFVVEANGLKHNIILSELPNGSDGLEFNATLDYSGTIRLADGLSLYLHGVKVIGDIVTSSRIDIENSSGVMLYYLPEPYAYEQGNPTVKVNCQYEVKESGSDISFYIKTPLSWLKDSNRQFPIVIDPTYTVGTTTTGGIAGPFSDFYGYRRDAAIYTYSQITAYGTVTSLGWQVYNVGADQNIPCVIYLKTTSSSTFTSDTWSNTISGATTCYSGNISVPSNTTPFWITINLTTSFSYAANNLEVLTEANYGGGGNTSNYNQFCDSSTSNAAEAWGADNSPPTGSGTVTSSLLNIQITYPSAINISGSSNSSGTIKVAVNGTLQAQTTSASASWTLSSVSVGSGNVVTVWVDTATVANQSTGVTIYDGTGNITGMVLNSHILSIGSADNASMTVVNMGYYTHSNNSYIMHGVSGSTLTVDAGSQYSDETIDILSSNTLIIGTSETLNTQNLQIDGTLTSSGNSTYNVDGTWTNNGTFTSSTSTVTFSGTTAVSLTTATTFYNVNVGDGTNAKTLTMSNLTYLAGGDILRIKNNGDLKTTVSGSTPLPHSGWFYYYCDTGSTVEFGYAGTQTIPYNWPTGTGNPYYNVTVSGSGTKSLNGATVLNGTLTISVGTFDVTASNYSLSVGGNWTNNDTFTCHTGTVTFNGGVAQSIGGTSITTFYNLTVTGSSTDVTCSISVTVSGTTNPSLKVGTSSTSYGTFEMSSGTTLSMGSSGGIYVYGDSTFKANGTYTSIVTITHISSGYYTFAVYGTLNMQYYNISYTGSMGLDLFSGTTITNMNDGTFGASNAGFCIRIEFDGTFRFYRLVFTVSSNWNFDCASTGITIYCYNCTTATISPYDYIPGSGPVVYYIDILIYEVDLPTTFKICNNQSQKDTSSSQTNYDVPITSWYLKNDSNTTVYTYGTKTLTYASPLDTETSSTNFSAVDSLGIYETGANWLVSFVAWGGTSPPSGTQYTNATGSTQATGGRWKPTDYCGYATTLYRNSTLPYTNTDQHTDWCPEFPDALIHSALGIPIVLGFAFCRRWLQRKKRKKT